MRISGYSLIKKPEPLAISIVRKKFFFGTWEIRRRHTSFQRNLKTLRLYNIPKSPHISIGMN